MKKINLIIIILILAGMIGTTYVEAYVKPQMNKDKEQYAENQQDPEKHDFKAIIKYSNKYMGNASNIINLNYNLPLGNIQKTFQLVPDKLTVEINYEKDSSKIDQKTLSEALIYNSTANFVLIDNLQVIKFNFKEASYTISRDSVENWYDVKLSNLKNEAAWEKNVQNKLNNESYVDSFISKNVAKENIK